MRGLCKASLSYGPLSSATLASLTSRDIYIIWMYMSKTDITDQITYVNVSDLQDETT